VLLAAIVRTRTTIAARRAWYLGALGLGLLLSCCRLRPSSTGLGGTREEAALPSKAAGSAAASSAALVLTPDEEKAAVAAEAAPATAASAELSKEPAQLAAPGAFQVKPYAAHQTWTRSFDLEFALKVGPGGNIDMKMVSHQEARFEVLSVANGAIEKLQIEYPVYTSKMTIMGAGGDSPEELAGKRFIVTFTRGLPEVRDASGGKPPKKQADSVKDDAREPLEIEKALKELALLAAKGQGDFSLPAAVAVAGGEDEDTKVPKAKARLRQLTTGGHNEKLALLDVGYTLTNTVDEKSTIEVQVSGSLSVLDAPARYQTSTLQGPMEIRSSEPGGMQGRGTVKITTSYKY
jgi:hypothetical protein